MVLLSAQKALQYPCVMNIVEKIVLKSVDFNLKIGILTGRDHDGSEDMKDSITAVSKISIIMNRK